MVCGVCTTSKEKIQQNLGASMKLFLKHICKMLILALKLDHHTQMLMHQLLSSFWLTKLFKQNSQILMQKQQQNIIHTAANFGKFANIICSYFPFCLQVSFTWFLFIPSRQLHIYIPTQQKNTGWSCIESGLPTDVCDFA